MPGYLTSHIGLTLAMLPAFFGIRALLMPEDALLAFRFSTPSAPGARTLTRSLVRIYGIRNVAVSYLLALLWSTGDDKLKGLGLLAGIAMCFTDGLMSIHVRGGGEWSHWLFAPAVGGVCAGLFGWFD